MVNFMSCIFHHNLKTTILDWRGGSSGKDILWSNLMSSIPSTHLVKTQKLTPASCPLTSDLHTPAAAHVYPTIHTHSHIHTYTQKEAPSKEGALPLQTCTCDLGVGGAVPPESNSAKNELPRLARTGDPLHIHQPPPSGS